MKYLVQLINRDLGHSHPPRLVQDRNGILIGRSRWHKEYNCHALETPLTIEQYHACADRLALCWHMAMMRWQPRFIVVDETPAPSAPSTPAPVETVTVAVIPYTEAMLCDMRKSERVEIAKLLGLDPSKYSGPEKLVKAIMEAQPAAHD